jgi:succinate dehydrogenase/fumarate reductase cytochrome b subunit
VSIALPRNTTHQSEGWLVGEIARVLHRLTGAVIVVFVLVHTVGQAALHAPALAAMRPAASAWLPVAQSQHWIHAILYFSLVFHTLHGLRLIATELGARIDYRVSLWMTVALSTLVGLREVARYVG